MKSPPSTLYKVFGNIPQSTKMFGAHYNMLKYILIDGPISSPNI